MTRRWVSLLVPLALGAAACSGGSAARTVAGSAPSTASVSSTVTVRSSLPSTASTGSSSRATKPNVLFVLTDDMRFDDMQYLPQVRQLIGDAGMTFDNQFDNVTLCCPARTSILRGQYSHNTGVLTNDAKNGGFETAHQSGLESATVATAMHDDGYLTGLFGKYLNGYPATADASFIPPGWDRWASSTKGNAYGEYNYTLNQNGQQVDYGRAAADYGTDVYVNQTKNLINEAAKSKTPFFAYLAVYAPHEPATPAPQDVNAFPGLKAARDPSFNEADVSDKPQYIRDLPLLGAKRQDQIDLLARRRAQSLQAVDRGVANLVQTLQTNGQLDNTVIIFTSDNGFHLGQHRLPAGKQTAYETDIHLPLLVRGPGIAAGAHVAALTGNIDLAPTIAALGGTALADDPDGRSLVPLLDAKPSGSDPAITTPAGWRVVYLLEHWSTSSTVTDRPGAGQLEPDDQDQGGETPADDAAVPATTAKGAAAAGVVIPEFHGLRIDGYTYVEYVTGERELYDIKNDPDELHNLASTASAPRLAALHQRLEDLRTCKGATCRSVEDAPFALPA